MSQHPRWRVILCRRYTLSERCEYWANAPNPVLAQACVLLREEIDPNGWVILDVYPDPEITSILSLGQIFALHGKTA